MPRLARACLAASLVTLAESAASQDEASTLPPPVEERDPTWTFASGHTLSLFPSGDRYTSYIADPHKPESGAMAQLYTRSRIHDTTGERFALKAGGRFGVIRLDPGRPAGRSWQLSIAAGLDFQVDSQRKQDAIGWDGRVSLETPLVSTGIMCAALQAARAGQPA
jgi:hypothetical protein